MGGIQFPRLNSITRDIWQWCEDRHLWIFGSYIASRDNLDADRESRITNVNTEWELAPELYHAILNEFGRPEIDFFTSRINSKCQTFCSWHKDPAALCVDAFTLDWKKYDFYAFPPFALLLRVLKKIQSDQARGILVVPDWKTQPWFPLWSSILVRSPLVFYPDDSNLLSPCRTLRHPLASRMRLMAGVLSGRHFDANLLTNSPSSSL